MTEQFRPTLTRTQDGGMYMEDNTETKYLLNPKNLSNKITSYKNYAQDKPKSNKFKLVTVHRLTDISIEEATALLEQQQQRAETAALRSGSPAIYPAPIENINLKQVFGVYIDEDLYGRVAPVYVFFSPSDQIQAYITATGADKNTWMVSIAHTLSSEDQPDGSRRIKWRIYHIDNSTPDVNIRTDYVLDSNALPSCFEHNFSISNLHYLGGGTWNCLAIDPPDRLPVYEQVRALSLGRYIPVGQVHRGLGLRKVKAIVAYSCTPSYSMTWCRGNLELNFRDRKFNQKTDVNGFIDSGVISTTRSHEYFLNIHYRPDLSNESRSIVENIFTENSYGSATYVGTTNYRVNSAFQSPDYGTDVARLSLANYTMQTNVIRPEKVNEESILPILSSSYNMSYFLRVNLGTATGNINHPFQVINTVGKRGYDYKDFYKFWWTYGKVVGVYSFGDTGRYRRGKLTGSRTLIGDMFDLGELLIHGQNRVITTWDALPNPQTGFFGFVEGTLTFFIQSLNPPIFGHDGVYYYELNPLRLDQEGSGYYDRSFVGNSSSGGSASTFGGGGRDVLSNQQSIQSIYSQMLGGLGGGALESVNIGFVNIATKDVESTIVREPNQDQKAARDNDPHIFPGGFWESDLLDIDISNSNEGLATSYNADGTITTSWVF